jgi:hypothetical protein
MLSDEPGLTAEPAGTGDGTVETEWGVRYDEDYVQPCRDEETARKIARLGADLGHAPVSRKVTYGPWEKSVPVHYRWPVACGAFSPDDSLWTGNLDRVTCAACRAAGEDEQP